MDYVKVYRFVEMIDGPAKLLDVQGKSHAGLEVGPLVAVSDYKALQAEVTALQGVLDKLSGVMPHQHCATCNQFAETVQAALATPTARWTRENK